MINVRHIFLTGMLLLATACSSDHKAPKAEQTPPQNAIQETVDSFIQPRINALEKARGLEKTLKDAEERRLKTIEGFAEQE